MSPIQNKNSTQYHFFLVLLIAVSIGFIWLLLPYYSAIFWAVIFSVLFRPLNLWFLKKIPKAPNTAALITLVIALLVVIIPLITITTSLIKEISLLYQRIQSGELNLGLYFEQIIQNLPPFFKDILDRYEIHSLFGLRERLTEVAAQGSKFLANQALNIGQDTFQFLITFGIMLYLLFFLLRDGGYLVQKIKSMIPLEYEQKQHLLSKFATVVKATVKGNILVAATQGLLGGFIFSVLGIQGSLLWGTIMGFLSLLPAIGAALIWFPVAVYFLVTGETWHGVILILYGVLIIGLTDNVLRPLLVGKDTKLPDYVILISTIGGLTVFGPNGFVIGPLIAALFISCWDLFPSSTETSIEASTAPDDAGKAINLKQKNE